jgi:hypothetical protein
MTINELLSESKNQFSLDVFSAISKAAVVDPYLDALKQAFASSWATGQAS